MSRRRAADRARRILSHYRTLSRDRTRSPPTQVRLTRLAALYCHQASDLGDSMARPRELVPGNCYFSLKYFDSELVIPSVQTLIFVGTESDENGDTMWLFREPASPTAETDPPASEDKSVRSLS